jgi:hypothetical protein
MQTAFCTCSGTFRTFKSSVSAVWKVPTAGVVAAIFRVMVRAQGDVALVLPCGSIERIHPSDALLGAHVAHGGTVVFWTGSMTLFEVSHFDKQLPQCTSKDVFSCRMLLA